MGGSEYERLQIESILSGASKGGAGQDEGLYLSATGERYQTIHAVAVEPAMVACGLKQSLGHRVFDSDSLLSDVYGWISSADVIVVDLSSQASDLMYVLGLCHGSRRCPILLGHDLVHLPFNLTSLRSIEYRDTPDGLIELRECLTRAVRVFLTMARSTPK